MMSERCRWGGWLLGLMAVGVGCNDAPTSAASGSAKAMDDERESTPQELLQEGAEESKRERKTSKGERDDRAAQATAAASAFAPAPAGDAGRMGGLSGQGYGGGGRGAPSKRYGVSPQSPPADAEPSLVAEPIDPNGRFATTYRPGGGHLAAFESAVNAGLVPAAEREVVSDVGARYVASLGLPKSGALAFQTDLERSKMAPGGGPVHLRFTLRSSDQSAGERPPVAVAVVMDVSGSMRGELIQSARNAASSLVDKLSPRDELSVITFSSDAQVLIPMGKIGQRKEQLKATIQGIKEGGGTNISGGLTLGYKELAKVPQSSDAVRVSMLLSDGRANEGITHRPALSKLALDAFQDGIQTSAFGLGTNYDGPLMSQIANDGAGGYYFLKTGDQIAAALSTELDKRLDPVATAVEVRVRVKPGVEVLDVYGSRRLSQEEATRVRTIELASDKQTEKRDKIKANRQDDPEGGMRFFIPAFARDDSHTLLFKLKVPASVADKDLVIVELKYKDRLLKKNVTEEAPVKVPYAKSDMESMRSLDKSVQRTVQGFMAGQALMKASRLIAEGKKQAAADLLAEREGLLAQASSLLEEPLFLTDAKRLARLRGHIDDAAGLGDPLVLAMMMEAAGNTHLR